MGQHPIYRRILLKLSGEALMGEQKFGIAPEVVARLADEIRDVHGLGVQTAVVIGGGNIIRGVAAAAADDLGCGFDDSQFAAQVPAKEMGNHGELGEPQRLRPMPPAPA